MGQGASSLLGAIGGGASAIGGAAVSKAPEYEGYSPQGYGTNASMGPVAGSSDQSMSSQATPVNAPNAPPNPAENLKSNMGLMQKFTNLLGKDPKEREANAKIFAALVKDLGNVGKSLTDSTLMQRMMSEQMNGIVPLGAAGQGSPVGPIARQDFNAPIMPSGGFR